MSVDDAIGFMLTARTEENGYIFADTVQDLVDAVRLECVQTIQVAIELDPEIGRSELIEKILEEVPDEAF